MSYLSERTTQGVRDQNEVAVMGDMSFRMSPEINEIAAAIAKAQLELENVEKSGVNPAFRAAYTKLGAVLEEVRPKYAKHGIAITQIAVNGEGQNVGVVTLLAHSSGQWLEGRFYVAPAKFDAQGAGSALTYVRRYALMAMTGVAPDDDDGNAAVGRPERAAAKPAAVTSGERSAAPPQQPQTNGKAPSANGALDPAIAQASAARDRIFAAIENAKTPNIIDEILSINAADLDLIKNHGPATYERLIQHATAKSSQLRLDDEIPF